MARRTIFRGRAPLRLGLAGGGTDVSPYCDEYGGAILNVTIGRYAITTVELLTEPVLQFQAQDIFGDEELPLAPKLALNDGLILHRAVYNVIVEKWLGGKAVPLRMTTHVESPMGSGLGSSSTLVVSMIEAMREAFQLPLGEYDVAHLAFHIEREVAGFAGGRQDHFAATFGGVNYMEFQAGNRVIVNPLRIRRHIWTELEASLILCFTGISRVSADIIKDQTNVTSDKKSRNLQAMHQLKSDAYDMKNALLVGNMGEMAAILKHSWEAKKQTSKMITNARIEDLYACAMESGALAGKVSGAGGGGFMFFFVDPRNRNKVVAALMEKGGDVISSHMTATGAESWPKLIN